MSERREDPGADDERADDERADDERTGDANAASRRRGHGRVDDARTADVRTADARDGEARDDDAHAAGPRGGRARTDDTRTDDARADDADARPPRGERARVAEGAVGAGMVEGRRRFTPLVVGGAAILLILAFVIGRATAPSAAPSDLPATGESGAYTCSMHPQIRQPGPGSCPICGMDLVPVRGGETHRASDRVVLSERGQALARVRTTEVRRLASGGVTRRMLGRVDYDETTLHVVTAWIGGRIERLHVDVTGERVRRGQVLASLYSPEVYAAQQDLLTAHTQVDRLAGGSELARASASAALESARQRLRLLGVPEAEITRLESAGRPSRDVDIRSPFSGTVLERLVSEGAYVETGTPLYRLADLGRLWVQLDAYESDLAEVAVGQTVELSVEAFGDEVFEGRVAFVDPVVDPRRRTTRVRVEVSNPEGRLLPGMFVQATLRGEVDGTAQPLVIPASAPLFTGRRSVVYVAVPDTEEPTYEAREVRLAPQVGDLFPVVAGLAEGERVVTEGAFALDADLQIQGGRSMMSRGDDTDVEALEVPEAWRAALAPVVEAYLALTTRLAQDDADGARAAAGSLVTALDAVDLAEPPAVAEAWAPIAESLRVHASRAAAASAIEEVRGELEPLGLAMATLLRVLGNPTEVVLRQAFCPMAFDNRGASWIQTAEAVDNAYFGAAMRTCGSIRETVAPGAHLAADPSEDAPLRPAPASPIAPAPRRAPPNPASPAPGASPAAPHHHHHADPGEPGE